MTFYPLMCHIKHLYCGLNVSCDEVTICTDNGYI